ncbi:MAG: GntR family transcriptional regulator [Alphaproteobacteria bacterium]|nr:GntR family transcriptional regulator [Alphaproteobacteria bacterium]
MQSREEQNGSQSAVAKAYADIRRRIIANEYQQGERLKEEDLAVEVGVSRTPIREALRRLAIEGMVELRPNYGAFVSTWSSRDLEQMFDLRATLEGSVAAMATPRMSAATIAELRALAEQMVATAAVRQPDALERIAELNDTFHKMILVAAESPRLSRLMGQLVELPIVLRTFNCYDEEELQRSLGHHRELVAAFTARDGAWAEAVMRAHVLAAKHSLLAVQLRHEAEQQLRTPEAAGHDSTDLALAARVAGRG